MPGEKDRIEKVFRERERLAGRYSLDNPGNRFNFDQLRMRIKNALQMRFDSFSSLKILDLGAGDLFWADKMVAMGFSRSNCFGADLLSWRIAEGRSAGRMIEAVVASGEQLPFASESFDLVSQFTMMTSVLDPKVKAAIACEMLRVLRPGGYIIWYDFRYNNPANKNARAIGRKELRRLFSQENIDSQSLTLVPQMARKVGPVFYPLLKFAAALPILRTHYLAFIGPKG